MLYKSVNVSCHEAAKLCHDNYITIYGWMDGWMDGWDDGWMDGWMGGMMDG